MGRTGVGRSPRDAERGARGGPAGRARRRRRSRRRARTRPGRPTRSTTRTGTTRPSSRRSRASAPTRSPRRDRVGGEVVGDEAEISTEVVGGRRAGQRRGRGDAGPGPALRTAAGGRGGRPTTRGPWSRTRHPGRRRRRPGRHRYRDRPDRHDRRADGRRRLARRGRPRAGQPSTSRPRSAMKPASRSRSRSVPRASGRDEVRRRGCCGRGGTLRRTSARRGRAGHPRRPLREEPNPTETVVVGAGEGLGGPSWQEPGAVEVGADVERRGPGPGERDVPGGVPDRCGAGDRGVGGAADRGVVVRLSWRCASCCWPKASSSA